MKLDMDIDHSTLYSMLYGLGFNSFTSARDHLGATEAFYERCHETLINNVRKGKDHPNYIQIDEGLFIKLIENRKSYKIIADRLNIGERTVYEKSYELLNMPLEDADRIYRVYPEVERKLLNSRALDKKAKFPFLDDLISSGLTVKEIDREILKICIALGYSKKEIEHLFGWDHYRMTRWLPTALGLDFYQARDEFWWKPRIIWLFRLGYTARQMRDVSKRLIGKYVTQGVLTRIFAEEYKVHGSSTWKYLENLYGSQSLTP